MTDLPDGLSDPRLYLPEPDGYEAKIKSGWEKEYCSLRNPGEDYFHLLMTGEIYLERGTEKLCLRCALRQGVITRDRLNWQHGAKRLPVDPPPGKTGQGF